MRMATKLMRTSGHKPRPIKQPVAVGTMKVTTVSIHRYLVRHLLRMHPATNGGAIPFNTQFFHDDYDDGPGFDDDGDAGEALPDIDAGEQDLLAATAGQARRIRPEFVNYAKKAKRVDVRKLKENIWRGLDIKIAEAKEEGDEDDSMVIFHSCHYDSKLKLIFRRWTTRTPRTHPKVGCSAL